MIKTITTVISIAFALTFPKSPMDLPKVTDIANMEVHRIEILKADQAQKELKESMELMRVTEEKAKQDYLTSLTSPPTTKPSKTRNIVATRGSNRDLGVFTVTCYDLSVQSCGKLIGSKGYGVTASGFNLTGHTWESARTIAVDPKVIPLGSEVEITFTNEVYSKYNGVYIARDTGGAIKQKKIDFFLGDFNQNKTHQSVWNFGKTKAELRIITKGGK